MLGPQRVHRVLAHLHPCRMPGRALPEGNGMIEWLGRMVGRWLDRRVGGAKSLRRVLNHVFPITGRSCWWKFLYATMMWVLDLGQLKPR